jgi:hypothetical protein
LAGDKPRLQVFSTCRNLIRTLPVMTYDGHRTEDIGDGLEDHACESLRYGIMSRPRPAPVKKKPKEPVYNPLAEAPKRKSFMTI